MGTTCRRRNGSETGGQITLKDGSGPLLNTTLCSIKKAWAWFTSNDDLARFREFESQVVKSQFGTVLQKVMAMKRHFPCARQFGMGSKA